VKLYMGIDIVPGSNPRAEEPKFAYSIIQEDGRVIDRGIEIPLSRILRICWETRPSILASDNIYELAPNEFRLAKIISMLPQETELVQVTRVNGEFVDLRELIRRNGIEVQGKLDPEATSYFLALLSSKGIGTKVTRKETKVKIIVRRGRGLGPGGMSQNRYKRLLRGAVYRVAKYLKEQLDSHGFDYDLITKKSKFGLERATFIVYTTREKLFGVVKKMKGYDVIVEIKPVYGEKILFQDEKLTKSKGLIIGVDPGINVGVSVIDSNGKPILLLSRKSMDRETVISKIVELGKPLIIATDVNPPPEFVRKLSSSFGCKLYVPEEPLSIDEKEKLVSEFSSKFNVKIEDPHIRDSLAAALKAYNSVQSKYRKIEGYLRRIGVEFDVEEIFESVIEGKPIFQVIEEKIRESLSNYDKQMEVKVSREERAEQLRQSEEITSMKEELITAKKELERLRKLVYSLSKEKEMIERRIEELKIDFKAEVAKDREIYMLRNSMKAMERVLNDLRTEIDKRKEYEEKLVNVIDCLVQGECSVLKANLSGKISYFLELPDRVENGTVYLVLNYKNVIREGVLVLPANEYCDFLTHSYCVIKDDIRNDLEVLINEKLISEMRKIDLDKLEKLIFDYRMGRKNVRV
jgi:predicted RNase H-like nuclease (RuvC/YqgF family)